MARREFWVDDFGADPTGTSDSTGAFSRALTAMGSTGVIKLGWGTYKIGTSSDLPTFGAGQGMVGPGSQLCTLSYVGSGYGVKAYQAGGGSAGPFQGFKILGTSSASAGMFWGNLGQGRNYDIQISSFTSGVGIHFYNDSGQSSEGANWQAIRLVTNGTAVVFDGQGANAQTSYDYSTYEFLVIANSGQHGVFVQNDAQLVGVHFAMRGDFHGGAGNTGIALGIEPSSGGSAGYTANISNSLFNVVCEADGSGTGHIPLKFQGAAGVCGLFGEGIISFINGGIAWQNASASTQYGNIGVRGAQIPGIGASVSGLIGNSGDTLAVLGGTSKSQRGTFGSLATLSLQYGDVLAYQLASGNNNVAWSIPTSSMARSGYLYLEQPNSGSAGTVTWPSGTLTASGFALSSTNSYVDRVKWEYLPSTGHFYLSNAGTFTST